MPRSSPTSSSSRAPDGARERHPVGNPAERDPHRRTGRRRSRRGVRRDDGAVARRGELPRLGGAGGWLRAAARGAPARPRSEAGSSRSSPRACGSSGDSASCEPSSLMVLLTNLLEAPFPVVMSVFARGGVRERRGPRAHVRRLRRRRRSPASLVYSAIGHRLPRRRTFLVVLRGRTDRLPGARGAAAAAGRTRSARLRRARRGPDQPAALHGHDRDRPDPSARPCLRRGPRRRLGGDPARHLLGGVLVGAIGVAATFLAIGVLLALVVAYGFFNPAFREMDTVNGA